MTTRRKFLGISLAGSAGLITQNLAAAGRDPAPQRPIVISTWDFGRAANLEAWKVLSAGGTALDAVEAGVKVPEADPTNHSVGYGGLPDRDGHVTLDACIMDEAHRCGSVMGLEHIVHAISVARMVMEKTPHVVLCGEGALQFALDNGFTKENLLTPESEAMWKEWLKTSRYHPGMNVENALYEKSIDSLPGGKKNHDTIGMLAIDSKANLSGACTTSGLAYKMRGRVGDSPIIGAGLYVDNEVGAATSTGVGEEVIRIVGSHLVVEGMRHGLAPQQACIDAVRRLVKYNPAKAKDIQVGFLAIDRNGKFGAYALQKGFTYSVKSEATEQVFPADYYYKN